MLNGLQVCITQLLTDALLSLFQRQYRSVSYCKSRSSCSSILLQCTILLIREEMFSSPNVKSRICCLYDVRVAQYTVATQMACCYSVVQAGMDAARPRNPAPTKVNS